jgi:hypothetical protein
MKLPGTRRQRVGYVTGCLVIVLLVIGLFLWFSADNEGTITPPDTVTAGPAYRHFDGRYIAFNYKGMYGVRTLPAADYDLELYTFKAGTVYDKHIAVSVSKLPEGKLTNNSAYNLRQSQPETYTRREIQVAGAPATLWVKTDGKEETAIIPRGSQVAVLSFVSQGNVSQLDSEVTALLQTFTWK